VSPPPAGSGTGSGSGTGKGGTGTSTSLADALKRAQQAYDDGQKALRASDWQKYGEAQKRLAAALKDAQALEKGAKQGQ
jgi:hypothetical protein